MALEIVFMGTSTPYDQRVKIDKHQKKKFSGFPQKSLRNFWNLTSFPDNFLQSESNDCISKFLHFFVNKDCLDYCNLIFQELNSSSYYSLIISDGRERTVDISLLSSGEPVYLWGIEKTSWWNRELDKLRVWGFAPRKQITQQDNEFVQFWEMCW